MQVGWEKPTYKYGTEARDPYKSNWQPGPGAYNVQVDRTGSTTFTKKKPAGGQAPDAKWPDAKLVNKSLKKSKAGN
jgi:hypothetical protein